MFEDLCLSLPHGTTTTRLTERISPSVVPLLMPCPSISAAPCLEFIFPQLVLWGRIERIEGRQEKQQEIKIS